MNIAEAKAIIVGAAKIVQKVAEKKPSLVTPYLNELIPELEVPESQSCWMIISVFVTVLKNP